MKMLKSILSMLLLSFLLPNAFAKDEKWYRVEMIVFEMGDKNAASETSDPGMPSFTNAVSLTTEPNAEFSLLTDKQLSLNNAKQRIQKRYPLVLHKGWRQVITDKDHSQKVRLTGGKNDEVDGTVRLSLGRNLNVDADLLFKKIGSANVYRLKESSRLHPDEIAYIDHPNYGVIVMVTPEKSTAPKPAAVEEKPVQAVKTKAAANVEVEDNDKPIFPSQRQGMIKKGS